MTKYSENTEPSNSTKPLLTAVFYCQMLNFSAFHRFFFNFIAVVLI